MNSATKVEPDMNTYLVHKGLTKIVASILKNCKSISYFIFTKIVELIKLFYYAT